MNIQKIEKSNNTLDVYTLECVSSLIDFHIEETGKNEEDYTKEPKELALLRLQRDIQRLLDGQTAKHS